MPTERVLIEVITTAQLGGLEQAKAGMMGMNLGTLALAAALGGLIVVGKAGLDNYASQETALLGLQQAVQSNSNAMGDYKTAIENFIQTNAAYISNQYDVITALADLYRAGNNAKDSMRMLNIALDMAVVKQQDVSTEALLLEKVLMGNGKALKEVGVSTTQYSHIMKSHHTQAWKVNQILDIMEQKYLHGRTAIDKTKSKQDELTLAWQDFTVKTAPGVKAGFDDITTAATTALGILTLVVDALTKLQSLQATTAAHGDFWDGFIAAMNGVMPTRTTGHGTAGAAGHAPGSGSARTPIALSGPEIDNLANAIGRRLASTSGS